MRAKTGLSDAPEPLVCLTYEILCVRLRDPTFFLLFPVAMPTVGKRLLEKIEHAEWVDSLFPGCYSPMDREGTGHDCGTGHVGCGVGAHGGIGQGTEQAVATDVGHIDG